jgi:uncharacterized protein YjdB
MITGVPPFIGSTYSVIQAHVEQEPRPLREQVPDCPPELEQAVLRMLAKNPQDRWGGMNLALTALGATALAEEDPLRAELSRLATAGARTSFAASQAGRPGGGKTSAVLQVTPPGMMRAITILPPPPNLEVGDSFLLVARVHDGHAARLPTAPVEWSSDTPGVLRVNATKAVATAVTPGTALIRAICDGQEGRLRVTVAAPRADAINIKPVDKTITVGDEIRLEATPRDKRGQVVTRPVTWQSEDDGVATVSLDGVLVARAGGTTRITAELDEARTGVAVTVLPPRVAAVHISAPPESVTAGESFALTATPLDRWAGPLADRTISWSVSDVNIALVTAGGWVIARNPGLVVLTAVCEGVSASVSVNVVERAAEPLPEVHPHPPRVAAGVAESQPWELRQEIRVPEPHRSRSRRGWIVVAGAAFLIAGGSWLAGDRIQPDPGAMPESAIGVTDSTPASEPDLQPAAFALAPESKPPRSVTITQRPARPLAVGSSASLAADVRDASGMMIDGASVIWTSTDSSVVSVDSTGILHAIAPGRAKVIALAGASEDTTRIVVRRASKETPAPPEVASLAIANHEPIRVGDAATLDLRALDRRGKPIRPATVTWSSSEPQVAEVHSTTGRVRAYAAGTTVLIARSGSESAITSLTVLPPTVASVAILGSRPLKVGDTLTLRPEPRDSRGRALADRQVEWGSSEPDIAPVDGAGVVIARAAGSTEISAASEGKSGTVRITVLPQPRTSRAELAAEAVARRAPDPAPPAQPADTREQSLAQMLAGVERCYNALARKDVVRVEELYKPETKTDLENLKKLGRILRTSEWEAQVGERRDGAQQLDGASPSMRFGFRLSWKDAFGGRLSSAPEFRAEFVRAGGNLELSSCRIIGSPKL